MLPLFLPFFSHTLLNSVFAFFGMQSPIPFHFPPSIPLPGCPFTILFHRESQTNEDRRSRNIIQTWWIDYQQTLNWILWKYMELERGLTRVEENSKQTEKVLSFCVSWSLFLFCMQGRTHEREWTYISSWFCWWVINRTLFFDFMIFHFSLIFLLSIFSFFCVCMCGVIHTLSLSPCLFSNSCNGFCRASLVNAVENLAEGNLHW